MKIAVEGCAHGELDKIYECLETLQAREGIQIDLLICCGDFQSVRNINDLKAMAVPDKYKKMCTFYKYYSGEKKAPVLTIFIGGNHEASNYLQELPYGGWVAPDIFYLGRAGVIKIGNLRIGGLSGIFKGHDYLQGLWECPPYTPNSLRSVYHIRSLDVFRLSQLKEKVHIMLSHDWPRRITDYGEKHKLLKWKPFLREDVESNQLGSEPAERLLHMLKPDYWFAAHLHCQFAAIVKHKGGSETKFLALDKCLPKRRHLQILEIPEELDGDKQLRYDEEWLAVLKITNHLLSVKNIDCHLPGPGGTERHEFTPSDEEKQAIVIALDDMKITQESFVRTAPVYDPESTRSNVLEPILNPQTVKLCELLEIDDPLQVLMARTGRAMMKSLSENIMPVPSPAVNTPIKCSKLSLPAPNTPSEIDDIDVTPQTETFFEDSSIISDTSIISECITPVCKGKKSFKRRNESIYTPTAEDPSLTTSSVREEDTPSFGKLPFRREVFGKEDS